MVGDVHFALVLKVHGIDDAMDSGLHIVYLDIHVLAGILPIEVVFIVSINAELCNIQCLLQLPLGGLALGLLCKVAKMIVIVAFGFVTVERMKLGFIA